MRSALELAGLLFLFSVHAAANPNTKTFDIKDLKKALENTHNEGFLRGRSLEDEVISWDCGDLNNDGTKECTICRDMDQVRSNQSEDEDDYYSNDQQMNDQEDESSDKGDVLCITANICANNTNAACSCYATYSMDGGENGKNFAMCNSCQLCGDNMVYDCQNINQYIIQYCNSNYNY